MPNSDTRVATAPAIMTAITTGPPDQLVGQIAPRGRRSRAPIVTDRLRGLVTLAGDHDDVAAVGAGESPARSRAGGRVRRRLVHGRARSMPADGGVDDRQRILVARVVGRDDHPIGTGDRGAPHQRPLLAIAVAAAAEHDRCIAARPTTSRGRGEQPRRGRRACGRSRRSRSERSRRRVATDLETPGHRGRRRDAGGGVVGVDAERGQRRSSAASEFITLNAPADRHRDAPARAMRIGARSAVTSIVGRIGQRDTGTIGIVGGVEQQPPVRIVDVGHADRRSATGVNSRALARKYASIEPCRSR